jgi:superfamily II DNA helicase RecQ
MEKVSKEKMLEQLDWIIELVKEKGIDTPKIIIFCSTLYAIGSVVNYIMMELNAQAFHPTSSKEMEHCVIGIYHSSTLPQYKERLLNSLKQNGSKRIAVATTALNMGVNFPDIRHVVTTHSIMRSAAQWAARCGADDSTIKRAGRWCVFCKCLRYIASNILFW